MVLSGDIGGSLISSLFESDFAGASSARAGAAATREAAIESEARRRRINEIPLLKKELANFVQVAEIQPFAQQAGDALAASVVEFMLEGLHVENRLNKNVKAGEITFKR